MGKNRKNKRKGNANKQNVTVDQYETRKKEEAARKKEAYEKKVREEKEKAEQLRRETKILADTFKLAPQAWTCRGSHVRNCEDKPTCLLQLGETDGILRRNEPNDNDDIIQKKRTKTQLFVGLKNLGATCYMNCILQCLFMNKYFRNMVFKYRGSNTFMKEFQLLFGNLQQSEKTFCSAEKLTGLLKISAFVQQDVQEFNTLLLNYVDEIMKEQENKLISNAITEEFEGVSRFSTTCNECDTVSHMETPFLELNLSIIGNKTIMEPLNEMKVTEELTGDNQYQCNNCGKLVDANRNRIITKLPPVLNVQLLRFVYDVKTNRKAKCNDLISFPLFLDLKTISLKPKDPFDPLDFQYKLSAVLLHLGESANCGHYVAQIYDDATSSWFTFNDKHIEPCDIECVGNPKIQKTDNKNPWQTVSSPSPSKTHFSSENAYMLIYTRVSRTTILSEEPPAEVIRNVHENNLKLNKLVTAHQSERNKETQLREKHFTNYKEFIRLASLPTKKREISGLRDFRWINQFWLSEWIRNGTSNEIDNSILLCPHGKVDPNAVQGQMKQISPEAWSFLFDLFQGPGPELTPEDGCLSCAITLYDHNHVEVTKKKIRQKMISLCNGFVKKDSSSFWVSLEWFQKWSSLSPDEDSFSPINELITCPHGSWASPKESKAIPGEVWRYLLDFYPESVEFSCDTVPCPQCKEEEENVAKTLQSILNDRLEERLRLGTLFKGMNPKKAPILPFCFLVPTEWAKAWRMFVKSPKISELSKLDNSFFFCDHGLLRYDINKEETFTKTPRRPFLFVSPSDWEYIVDAYCAKPEIKVNIVQNEKGEVVVLKCETKICETCEAAFSLSTLQERASYFDNGKIFVSIAYRSDLPMFFREKPGRDKTITISGSATDSVSLLKMKVTQVTGISPNQQEFIYLGGVLKDDVLLKDCLIVDCALIHMKFLEGVDDKPVGKLETKRTEEPGKREEERGFAGSLLSGDKNCDNDDEEEEGGKHWNCGVCTLQNPMGISTCAVCDSPAPQEDGTWICPLCTCINEANISSCIACEQKRK